jgi:hypothetical protein
MSRIIVCEEKHGTRYWDASSDKAWAESALAILTERWNDGYWYSDPLSPPSEWQLERQKDFERVLAYSEEEIANMAAPVASTVKTLRRQAKDEMAWDAKEHEFYKAVKTLVEAQDDGFATIGKGKYERQEPKAWLLLQEHSEHEYESVELVSLAKPRD